MISQLHVRRQTRLSDLLGSSAYRSGRPVLLVVWEWPPGAPRRTWLQALAAGRSRRNLNLAVVTADASVSRGARELGLPVAANAARAATLLREEREAAKDAGPSVSARGGGSQRVAQSPEKGNWLTAVVTALLVAGGASAVAALAMLVLPSATVRVQPSLERLEFTVPMRASLAIDQKDDNVGLIPGRYVSATRELRRSAPATGRERRPTTKATGVLLAANQTQESVRVPAGTVVRTGTGQDISFVTLDEVIVAPDSQFQQAIRIEAVEAGDDGNVDADSITSIEGAYGFQLLVTNPRPTGGGSSELLPVVAPADQNLLQAQLMAEAEASAWETLAPELREGEWLPQVGLDVELDWTATDFFTAEETEEVTMTMMVNISGVALDTADMVSFVIASLARETPAGGRLLPASLDLSLEPNPVWTGAELSFEVSAAVDFVREIPEAAIRRAVAGLTPEDALRQLQQYAFMAEPELELSPAARDRLPRLPTRIRVIAHVPA